MTIDWTQIGHMALMFLQCIGAFAGLLFLAFLNDLWLQHIMTPEEYQRMLDSYDDDYWP